MTVTAERTSAADEVVVAASRPGLITRCLLAPIRFYRMAISPLRPPVCRYAPSCSEYALEAIEIHGPARGAWLALRRLLRCHPFHRGGHDPVPPRVGTHSELPGEQPVRIGAEE